MQKCRYCRTKSVHVEEVRQSEDGPVIGFIKRCTKCDTIFEFKEAKRKS